VVTPGGSPAGFARVASIVELEGKLAAPGKPVMLDFYADWCVSCKEMEKFTFSDPKVRAKLDGMLLLQADVTGGSEQDRLLLKRFSLFGPPGIIFFDAQGREIKGLRVIGYQNAERFLKTLELAAAP
jgi:thiol:disulfide interchange protein DsbD